MVVTMIFDFFPSFASLTTNFVEAASASRGLPIDHHFAMKINSGGVTETKLPNKVNLELLKGVETMESRCENVSSTGLSIINSFVIFKVFIIQGVPIAYNVEALAMWRYQNSFALEPMLIKDIKLIVNLKA